jgi:hypothetical protein
MQQVPSFHCLLNCVQSQNCVFFIFFVVLNLGSSWYISNPKIARVDGVLSAVLYRSVLKTLVMISLTLETVNGTVNGNIRISKLNEFCD